MLNFTMKNAMSITVDQTLFQWLENQKCRFHLDSLAVSIFAVILDENLRQGGGFPNSILKFFYLKKHMCDWQCNFNTRSGASYFRNTDSQCILIEYIICE